MIRYISENPSRLDNSIGEEIKTHLITGPKGNSELFSRDPQFFPRQMSYTFRLKNRKKQFQKMVALPKVQAVKPSCPAEMTR